jgi:hypothetical protein
VRLAVEGVQVRDPQELHRRRGDVDGHSGTPM